MQKIILNSTYYDFLQGIIASRGQWCAPSVYWEGHHIIPKCLGGDGDARKQHPNIIRLSAAEHFTAHKLLTELFPDNAKLAYAFWAMCTCSNAATIATAEEYEAARRNRSKTIGKAVRTKLIGISASDQSRARHSQAQSGELNGFFGKKHSEDTRAKLASATSKAVRHVNTGVVYSSSYEAAAALGISRVLINNCCRGKQASTSGGMKFEYVNPNDLNRGIPGKNTLTKYERRREIIEIRKLVVSLNKAFPGKLLQEDLERLRRLATCENRRYLISLYTLFSESISQEALEVILDDCEISPKVRDIIKSL